MTAELHNIEKEPSDAEKAAAYKDRLLPVLEQACAIMDEIRRDGMAANFNLNFDGRTRVAGFDITKSML